MKIITIIFIVLFILAKLILKKNTKFIIDKFKKGNCIVFGAKGKGKDLLFQFVIWKRNRSFKKRKVYHQLSNIDYGYKTKISSLKEITDINNSYENFINNNINKINKNLDYEGLDFYISDSGIYLPCQYDYLLDKNYKSFPVFYAISRHLYKMNIHLNTQSLERPWKKIREQADSYFKCKGSIKLIFGIIIKCRYYERYESACQNINSMNIRTLNKFSKAEADNYQAINGKIKNLIVYLPKRKIKYDTRIFETLIFENVYHEGKSRYMIMNGERIKIK